MKLEKSSKKKSKVRISIAGASGSGKSYSSILLGYGLCNDFRKLCIIDCEHFSASLYSSLGEYNVINLEPPFHPERFIEAIKLAETSGMQVIVLDAASHVWSGKGGCLEIHERETAKMKVPNSFTAWNSVTPLYQKFIDAIVSSPCHVISTLRSKTEYILAERNGRQAPQKVGMAPMMRDGYEFEQTICLELDQNHKAFCTKDRSGLLQDKEPFVITPDVGRKIIQWYNADTETSLDVITDKISQCKTIPELLDLYKAYPAYRDVLKPEFEQQKKRILINEDVTKELSNQKQSKNGIH
jgi:hypothetical protein